MRLLIICQKVDEGDDVLGFFVYWIRALAQRVESVKVIALEKGGFDLPQNVEVISLGKEMSYSKFDQALRFYWFAFKFLLKSDGVFVHMAPEYVRALYPLNLIFRKPIVMWYAHIKVSPVAKWAIKHVNFVCTPSKESFLHDSDKVIATGHGINTELFTPMSVPIQGDVLSLGRISKVKRIEVLIKALKILKHDLNSSTVANIYGAPARPEDDAYLSHLRDLEHQWGLAETVHWKGPVSNLEAPQVYAAHRIFVRMQGEGGFGKVELEAMSMGIPAIVPTNIYENELAEWHDDLYYPEDDAHELAKKIERVLNWSDEHRDAYAKRAREVVVRRHNIEHVAETVVKLLESCVA